MNFSKSTVERFPFSSGGPNSKVKSVERKRPYIISNLSTSLSSSRNTPSNKVMPKTISSRKNKNPSSFTGSQKKTPVQLTTALQGKRSKVVTSKPRSSTSRGNFALSANKNTRPCVMNTPSLSRKKLVVKEKIPLAPNAETQIDLYTPKRKKFDTTASSCEKYSTPLTSPQILPNKLIYSDAVTEKDDLGHHDLTDKQPVTPSSLESTQLLSLDLGTTGRPSMNAIRRSPSVLASEEEKETNDNKTITTPGRTPMRHSSHRGSLRNASETRLSHLWTSSSLPLSWSNLDNNIDVQQNSSHSQLERTSSSFDILNNAFLEISVQDDNATQNSGQVSDVSTNSVLLWNGGNISQPSNSFSYENLHFPVPTPPSQNIPTSAQTASRIDWIGSMLSNVPTRKKKRGKANDPTLYGLNTVLLDTKKGPKASRNINITQYQQLNDFSVKLQGLCHRKIMQYLPSSRELRRLLTMQQMQVSVVVPVKTHLQSQQFWMPIVEFFAEQVFEILRNSLK